mmetsp:Transcript_19618/g.36095  ORF Transcript_19618/g.36095 Transcript_19618/m.36095 type:complete len:166 (-) Transcript_19618:4006-4503(-)
MLACLLLIQGSLAIFETLTPEQRLMPFIHSRLSLGLELKRKIVQYGQNTTFSYDSDEEPVPSSYPLDTQEHSHVDSKPVDLTPLQELAYNTLAQTKLEQKLPDAPSKSVKPMLEVAERNYMSLGIMVFGCITVLSVICYIISKRASPKLHKPDSSRLASPDPRPV